MSEQLAKLEKKGGGGKGATFYTFGVSSLRYVTDASPLVINGDFSKVTRIQTTGQYAYSVAGEAQYYNNLSVTLGTKYKVIMGKYGSYRSYRNITVYANRIEIGTGYYDYTAGSDYGTLLTLIAPSDDDIVSY